MFIPRTSIPDVSEGAVEFIWTEDVQMDRAGRIERDSPISGVKVCQDTVRREPGTRAEETRAVFCDVGDGGPF